MPFGSDPFRDDGIDGEIYAGQGNSHQCLSAVIPFGTIQNILNSPGPERRHQCLSAVIPFGTLREESAGYDPMMDVTNAFRQ